MSELSFKWNGQSLEVSGVPESMQVLRDSIFKVEASESAFERAINPGLPVPGHDSGAKPP